MSMLPALLTAALLLTAGQAKALDLPSYDTQSYCRSLVPTAAQGAEQISNACLAREQRRRDQLAPLLKYFTEETMNRCDALARTKPGGSYQMLAGCLVLDLSERILDGKVEVTDK